MGGRYDAIDIGRMNLECGWSWLSEALRTLLGIVLVFIFLRMSEVLTFNPEVLLSCTCLI